MDRATASRTGPRATRLGLLAVAFPVVAWSFANTIVKLTPIPVLEFTFCGCGWGPP